MSVISGVAPVPAARRRAPARLAGILLGLPAILFLLVFFAWPMAGMVARSAPQGSLEVYAGVLADDLYVGVFRRSAVIALQVTLIDLLIAYPLAFYMTLLSGPKRLIAVFLILVPFWSSQLVRTYAWTILLGRNGVLNQALQAAGITDAPIPLLNNQFAVLLGSVHVMLPFMVLPLLASMQRIDRDVLRAAYLCGASTARVFWQVHLPMCRQGVAAGASLVFVLTLGSFTIAAVLGGGRVMMIALLIEQQVRTLANWEMASALATLFLLATTAVLVLMNRFLAGARKESLQ